MSDVVVISGAGPYADPWHSFPDTSARLASIIEDLGHTVSLTDEVETTLAEPGPCRLLVLNIGNPSRPRPPEPIRAARTGIEKHLANGGAILGIHSTATSLTTVPQWSSILGGRWVRGHSMHPPQGQTTITVATTEHPITSGLTDFVIFDERYSYLETKPDITVLCEHAYDGARHQLVWAREIGRSRIVYDGLGHDTTSYDSDGHVQLIRRAVQWLLGAL
jgi:uncharacterized protein